MSETQQEYSATAGGTLRLVPKPTEPLTTAETQAAVAAFTYLKNNPKGRVFAYWKGGQIKADLIPKVEDTIFPPGN